MFSMPEIFNIYTNNGGNFNIHVGCDVHSSDQALHYHLGDLLSGISGHIDIVVADAFDPNVRWHIRENLNGDVFER